MSAQCSSQWSRYACASSRLSNFLPFSGVFCAWPTPLSTFPLRSGAHLARKRRHAVVGQYVAVQGIQARIVDVRRQNAFTQVVQDHDPRCAAQPAKGLLVQLGPHPRTRPEGQQPNTLATATQRQYKQPCATVLAGIRIAHHRPSAVIHLALFPWPCLDDHSRFRRYCSAQLADESLNTLIAACKPVPIDQILIDTHRVAASDEFQLDHLAVRFTGSAWALATLLRQPHVRQKAGDHLYGRF